MFKWGRRNLTSGATIHEISYGVCLKIGSPMVLPKLMDSHHIAPWNAIDSQSYSLFSDTSCQFCLVCLMVIPANLPRRKAMSRVEKPNPVNPGNSAALEAWPGPGQAKPWKVLVKTNEHNGHEVRYWCYLLVFLFFCNGEWVVAILASFVGDDPLFSSFFIMGHRTSDKKITWQWEMSNWAMVARHPSWLIMLPFVSVCFYIYVYACVCVCNTHIYIYYTCTYFVNK